MGKRSGEKKLDFDIDDLWINPYSSNAVRNIYEVKNYATPVWLGTHRKQEKFNKKLTSQIIRLLNLVDNKIPIFMLYGIVNRDLGYYSKGGCKDIAEYKFYINQFVRGIKDKKAIVIIESDAFPHAFKLKGNKLRDRINCLKYAIEQLENTNCISYLDVGHPEWLEIGRLMKYIQLLPIKKMRGFSINVSNFISTEKCTNYAEELYKYTEQPSIIDVSKNRQQVSRWNNPIEQRLGEPPKMIKTKEVDMHLWIKIPGESDGKCFGFPRAGLWDKRLINILLDRWEI
jgi:endoglucanase